MKNKYLILGLALASLAGVLNSCKKDVEVLSTCKDIAQKTMIGSSKMRSGAQAEEDLILNVVQYQFLDGNKASRTELEWGNKVPLKISSKNLTYTVGEFGENGAGLSYVFTPENTQEAPYTVIFLSNAMNEQGTGVSYALDATDDKVSGMCAIDTAFNNIRCEYEKTEYWTKKVKYMDTTITKTRTGQKIIITEKERTDTLGIKVYEYNQFVFNRDASTLENTGYYKHIYKENEEDMTVVADTSVEYNCNWNVADVISLKNFEVHIKSIDPKTPDFWTAVVTKLDTKKGTATIDGAAYKFIED